MSWEDKTEEGLMLSVPVSVLSCVFVPCSAVCVCVCVCVLRRNWFVVPRS